MVVYRFDKVKLFVRVKERHSIVVARKNKNKTENDRICCVESRFLYYFGGVTLCKKSIILFRVPVLENVNMADAELVPISLTCTRNQYPILF